jgi:uncharacterized protein (TIGR02145 family)
MKLNQRNNWYAILLFAPIIIICGCSKNEDENNNNPPGNVNPVARFTVEPSFGTTLTKFKFDPSTSSDREHSDSTLKVRWDWENDGVWDTTYINPTTITHHKYDIASDSTTIKLEVEDVEGLTHSTLKTVVVKDVLINSFVDPRDGQEYKAVVIGNQVWMAENLNYKADTGSYCSGNNPENCEKYGRLYWNWTANEGVIGDPSLPIGKQGICPSGWHMPSDSEWKELEMYLGMSKNEADKLESFRGKDEGARLKKGGDFGFNALLGGTRNRVGFFDDVDSCGAYWSYSALMARTFCVHESRILRMQYPEPYALSVRCIKD